LQRSLFILGKSCGEVALQLGVTNKTISEWRSNSVFRAAINQGLLELREVQMRRMSDLYSKALATLEQYLDNQELDAEQKVKVSLRILNTYRIDPEMIGETNVAMLEFKKQLS
jgi:F0F1-type ATP synthase delta subunit